MAYREALYFSLRATGTSSPKTNDSLPVAEHPPADALCKAWARFEERVRRSLQMDAVPAKRLAEVADIAETIINYLLPDDEDDCRDTFENDYQLVLSRLAQRRDFREPDWQQAAAEDPLPIDFRS